MISIMLAAMTIPFAPTDDDLLEQIKAEYAKALPKLMEPVASLTGRIESTITTDPGTARESRRDYQFRFASRGKSRRLDKRRLDLNREIRVAEDRGDSKKSDQFTTVRTETKGFRVRKPGDGSDTVLEFLDADPKQADEWIYEGLIVFEAPFRADSYLVQDLLTSPAFELSEVSREQIGGRNLVSFRYRKLRLPSDRPDDRFLNQGRIVLAPDQGWRLERFEVEYGDGQVIRSEMKYDTPVGGHQMPKELIQEGEKNGRKTRFLFRFDSYNPGPVKESEFQPPSFGLDGAKKAIR